MAADLKDYRDARRAFIAACEKAGVDTIARVHPAKGADGRPLFMDSAALGPRLGEKAVVAIAQDLPGSQVLTQLLHAPPHLPGETRLVLVHAFLPAEASGPGDWLHASLQAVATEDLSRVRALAVLALGEDRKMLARKILPPRTDAVIHILPSASDTAAHDAIEMFLAGK